MTKANEEFQNHMRQLDAELSEEQRELFKAMRRPSEIEMLAAFQRDPSLPPVTNGEVRAELEKMDEAAQKCVVGLGQALKKLEGWVDEDANRHVREKDMRKIAAGLNEEQRDVLKALRQDPHPAPLTPGQQAIMDAVPLIKKGPPGRLADYDYADLEKRVIAQNPDGFIDNDMRNLTPLGRQRAAAIMRKHLGEQGIRPQSTLVSCGHKKLTQEEVDNLLDNLRELDFKDKQNRLETVPNSYGDFRVFIHLCDEQGEPLADAAEVPSRLCSAVLPKHVLHRGVLFKRWQDFNDAKEPGIRRIEFRRMDDRVLDLTAYLV